MGFQSEFNIYIKLERNNQGQALGEKRAAEGGE
jgi:hypothetical protein